MVYKKHKRYVRKRSTRKYRKRSYVPRSIRPEVKRRFVKVFDATTPSATFAITNNLPASRLLNNLVTGGNNGSVIGSKIFLKGIKIKGQFSGDATALSTLGEFSVGRLFVYTASSGALATRGTPAMGDILVNPNGDDSDLSAMTDKMKVSIKYDKRLKVSTTNNTIFFERYIKINKTHTYADNNADITSSTLGKYMDWYVSWIGGNSSGVASGPYMNLECMIYYTDV